MYIENYFYHKNSICSHVEGINQQSSQKAGESDPVPAQSFADVMNGKIEENELAFSKHAQQRLCQRDIKLSASDILKINSAVKKAEAKGIDNTLVLSDKGAFIVNVSNNTVITAMSGNDIKENVFTQIDGAVII